jgi:hypothetical protein
MMTTRRKFTAADFDAPCMDSPTWVKRALIDQQSVPDALMYNFVGDTYTIVEVKYCRDTDKATQRAKAIQQHQHLCESSQRLPIMTQTNRRNTTQTWRN